MRKKRILTAVAALALMLTAGCSGGTNAASGSSDALRVSAVSSDRPGVEAVIKSFTAKHSGTKISASYADTDVYQGNLRTQLASGTAPDVFFAWPGNGNPGAIQVLAPTGYLEDLSDRPWVKDIPSGIASVTKVGGKTYIVPETFAGIGALYNKTTFAQVGVAEPTTWTQVLAFCSAAKAKGKVAFALGNQTNWVTQLADYALAATLVYGKTPDFAAQMTAGKATFATSAWKTALDQYLEMNKKGCFSADPLGTSVDNSVAQVASGKAVALI
jgi:raffinose/stachyose/melibiose transport system substrate-binding protein